MRHSAPQGSSVSPPPPPGLDPQWGPFHHEGALLSLKGPSALSHGSFDPRIDPSASEISSSAHELTLFLLKKVHFSP